MSFSDPVHIIDHIPQDFDMKANHRRRRYKLPAQPRKEAPQQAQTAKAPEPFSRERHGRVWTLITFFGALAVMPAYWQDSHASLKVLDALMETRIADSYESSLKATLKISTELDAAIEHASWLIYNEVLELEYDEHPKPAHDDNIAPEEIPY